jgi:hypothetical protein
VSAVEQAAAGARAPTRADAASLAERIVAAGQAVRDTEAGERQRVAQIRSRIQGAFPGVLSAENETAVFQAVEGDIPVFQLPPHLQSIAVQLGAVEAFREKQFRRTSVGEQGIPGVSLGQGVARTAEELEVARTARDQRQARTVARREALTGVKDADIGDVLHQRALRRQQRAQLAGGSERRLQDREFQQEIIRGQLEAAKLGAIAGGTRGEATGQRAQMELAAEVIKSRIEAGEDGAAVMQDVFSRMGIAGAMPPELAALFQQQLASQISDPKNPLVESPLQELERAGPLSTEGKSATQLGTNISTSIGQIGIFGPTDIARVRRINKSMKRLGSEIAKLKPDEANKVIDALRFSIEEQMLKLGPIIDAMTSFIPGHGGRIRTDQLVVGWLAQLEGFRPKVEAEAS